VFTPPAIASPLARTPRSDLPLFVVGLFLVLGIVFAGFAPTFYLKGLFGTPPLSTLLFAHGLVMSAWIALLVVQSALVEFGRTDLHRRVGVVGAGVAVLLVVIGAAAALEAARRGFSPTPKVTPLMFLAIPLVDLLVFSILAGTALVMRRRAATHKRLMLLATVGMLTPAVARLPIDALKQVGLPAFFAVTIACVLLVVAIDTVRHRRLHPAFGWGAALVIAAVPGRIALANSDAWVSIAGRLVAMMG
jgi:hypothetical protein